jgi:type II secretory pathway component PulJ
LSKKGFTLVEIVLTLGLWLLGIFMFRIFLQQAAISLSISEKLTLALQQARAQMEAQRNSTLEAELSLLKAEVKWDAHRPPLCLFSLRSKYR